MSDYLSSAIRKLKPGAEFSYTNRDYSTINWIVLEGEAPTQAEIDDAIEKVKLEETVKLQAKTEAKAAAEGKLAALGLTVEDLQNLGL
jgi:hypothetical protein